MHATSLLVVHLPHLIIDPCFCLLCKVDARKGDVRALLPEAHELVQVTHLRLSLLGGLEHLRIRLSGEE